MNVVVIAGTLSSAPVETELPSGDALLKLEVTVRTPNEPTATVPVVVFGPSRSQRSLGAGAEVVVLGQVRRRFYRAGGGAASRTEVVAERVVAASRRRDAGRLVRTTVEGLAARATEQGWEG